MVVAAGGVSDELFVAAVGRGDGDGADVVAAVDVPDLWAQAVGHVRHPHDRLDDGGVAVDGLQVSWHAAAAEHLRQHLEVGVGVAWRAGEPS